MIMQAVSLATEVKRLDRAVKLAAKSTGAVLVDYVATRSAGGDGSVIELAIEFFVPPASQEQFDQVLRHELLRAGRSIVAVVSIIHSLPPGTLHQWRFAWKRTKAFMHDHRLTPDRSLIDSVLTQAAQGFRELHQF